MNERSFRPALWLAVLLPAWLACTGCDGGLAGAGSLFVESSPSVELVGQARPPIPDLPTPVGFNLDETRSRNFVTVGSRYVDHLYKGRAEKMAVVRFYQRHMPINRWEPITDVFSQGDMVMDFRKGGEFCRVTVAAGSLLHPVYVKVNIWSAARPGASPPTTRPDKGEVRK